MITWCLVVAALLCAKEAPTSGATEQDLVLTATSLGRLKLDKTVIISRKSLAGLFETLTVTEQIASSDGPDLHLFKVMDAKGEVLFTISSFITYDNYEQRIIHNPSEIHVDLLVVASPRIVDRYGMRVGMSYAEVIAARGRDVEFGANHHDVYLGGEAIYYNFAIPPDAGVVPGSPDLLLPRIVARRDDFGSSTSNAGFAGSARARDLTVEAFQKGTWRISSISWPASRW